MLSVIQNVYERVHLLPHFNQSTFLFGFVNSALKKGVFKLLQTTIIKPDQLARCSTLFFRQRVASIHGIVCTCGTCGTCVAGLILMFPIDCWQNSNPTLM